MLKPLVALAACAVLTPSVARADQAACSLRVLEAPAEVQDALVGWAAGEKRCHALEVRITPTGEGYSLWARASDGRTFTRWVADPKTAALLVVSWAGDDGLPEADPPPRWRGAAPSATPPPTALAAAPATTVQTATAPERPRRQLVVAAIGRPGDGEDVDGRSGLRASIDLTTHGAWRVGIAGMLSDEPIRIYSVSAGYRIATAFEPHASLMGYLARSFARDRIRLSAGVGVAYAQLSDVVFAPGSNLVEGPAMIQRVGIASPAIELSALAAYPLTARWSIVGGVVLTATGPTEYKLLKDPDHAFAPRHDDGAQLVFALGASRAL